MTDSVPSEVDAAVRVVSQAFVLDLVGERDRARATAVALEQELAETMGPAPAAQTVRDAQGLEEFLLGLDAAADVVRCCGYDARHRPFWAGTVRWGTRAELTVWKPGVGGLTYPLVVYPPPRSGAV